MIFVSCVEFRESQKIATIDGKRSGGGNFQAKELRDVGSPNQKDRIPDMHENVQIKS